MSIGFARSKYQVASTVQIPRQVVGRETHPTPPEETTKICL
jgi:hypothetical protein